MAIHENPLVNDVKFEMKCFFLTKNKQPCRLHKVHNSLVTDYSSSEFYFKHLMPNFISFQIANKKYAFEKTEVPVESQYLEVRYSVGHQNILAIFFHV